MPRNILKERGYRWEDTLTNRLNACYSSIDLPDVFAVSKKFSTIIGIEVALPALP
jgi:hypothetical protein